MEHCHCQNTGGKNKKRDRLQFNTPELSFFALQSMYLGDRD